MSVSKSIVKLWQYPLANPLVMLLIPEEHHVPYGALYERFQVGQPNKIHQQTPENMLGDVKRNIIPHFS